jgi:type IV secretory pathway component VirB8
MPMRTTPPFLDEAQLRIETEQRRAEYQARLERDRRLLVAFAGLVAVISAVILFSLAGLLG